MVKHKGLQNHFLGFYLSEGELKSLSIYQYTNHATRVQHIDVQVSIWWEIRVKLEPGWGAEIVIFYKILLSFQMKNQDPAQKLQNRGVGCKRALGIAEITKFKQMTNDI